MAKKKQSLLELERERQDLGFGTKATSTRARLVKRNGEFNVKKLGQSFEVKLNLYHRLITMHWTRFVLIIFAFYIFLNFFFATIYFGIGVENLEGIDASDHLSAFQEAFFFSSQTLTTVGYGKISPSGFITNTIAALEALLGLMSFALMTGLLYGRFSRPNPSIRFSRKAIISPYLDINALMFRCINERSNQLMNVSANMILSRNEFKEDGELIRRYHTLELERVKIKFFPMSWTIVHPITKESPMWGQTPESLASSDSEILVSLEGTNDTFADPIHARHSYLYNELDWGASFESILDTEGDAYKIRIQDIDKCKKADLNE
jgi:inward rectifier potassium channel